LIKGSRAMQMDRVVRAVSADADDASVH
jgi:hypothetical protein